MLNAFQGFLRDESGATAIEYSLVAGGIALAIITAVNNLGSTVLTLYAAVEIE